jgi:hypothetical protein
MKPTEATLCTDYTSKQIFKLTIPSGFWAVNVARLGAKPRWRVQHNPNRAVTCATCGESNTTACGGCWMCGRPLKLKGEAE